ncbi:hypothetical protein BDV96DRAFT_686568 [Lophiotrema nucula]|uniref:BZIP domain-containing protein n=1 Tax=Lophiotrema nucula TaxID=690887 RepID=A0A6A5ZAD1_9PLEO|nr:hypothetical protein BDV96DRAFT_686568 [Lophiotrema nucula]
MPAEKKRKAKTPEDVPEVGDPERKRVLNVLAQRRYRQRRREKIEALEKQANALTSPNAFDQARDGGVSLAPSDPSTSERSNSATEEDLAGIEEVTRVTVDEGFSMLEFDQDPVDFGLFQDLELSILASPLPSPPSLSNTISQSNSSASPTLNFPLTPDGSLLPIPALATLNAFSTIATMLNLVSEIYNPLYLHTLPSIPNPSLPPNLHPIPAQVAIPHHPLLDILPWPSVREKLICMFSLPSALRPSAARGDEGEGVMRIVQDLDDFGEGCRVHGNAVGWGEGSELVEEAWEVGECFYRNWWWCLDSKVVESTNRRRRERGLGALRLIKHS